MFLHVRVVYILIPFPGNPIKAILPLLHLTLYVMELYISLPRKLTDLHLGTQNS
jgi:hypothetical protein